MRAHGVSTRVSSGWSGVGNPLPLTHLHVTSNGMSGPPPPPPLPHPAHATKSAGAGGGVGEGVKYRSAESERYLKTFCLTKIVMEVNRIQ